jgi:hypothetical protein
VLVLLWHGERRHDDEDEQVVDRQALLDEVAGEVLVPSPPPSWTANQTPKVTATRMWNTDHAVASPKPTRCGRVGDDQVDGEHGEDRAEWWRPR